MDKLVGVAHKPPRARYDDDFVDRLSSRYTVMMLLAFTTIIGITQWIGKPMYCWVPKHFTKSHTVYANSFCWVNNTYYLPFHEYIPRAHEERHEIIYYQWITWILLAQAFFFWVPSVVWHGLNSKAGIDSDDIMASANKLHSKQVDKLRQDALSLIGEQLDRFLRARDNQISDWKRCGCIKDCRCCGRRLSAYLTFIYLLSKVCYVLNLIAQLFALNGLLKTEFQGFAKDYFDLYFNNATGAVSNGQFINSITFPRVTMCDFRIRILGNMQRYTVQCALPLNLYLEKMYLIFWFWLIILLFLTSIDLIIWLIRACVHKDRLNFVRNQLTGGKYIKNQDDWMRTERFLDEYLKQDGAFLLRMISHNTNAITTFEVTGKLFEIWKDRQTEDKRLGEMMRIFDEKQGTPSEASNPSDTSSPGEDEKAALLRKEGIDQPDMYHRSNLPSKDSSIIVDETREPPAEYKPVA